MTNQFNNLEPNNLTSWDSYLDNSGVMLTIACIGCYSMPTNFMPISVLLVVVMFWYQIKKHSHLYPDSMKKLHEKRKNGTISDNEIDMLKYNTKHFYSFRADLKKLLCYWIGALVFIFTLGYSLFNLFANFI